jgi:hypothetical protein
MTSAAQPAADANPGYSQLGGRLPLLTPAELDPAGLSKPAEIAHRLTLALAVDHTVGDDLYAEAHAAFGTEPLIALVNLIGRYMSTAAVLACFAVPVPPA